jgi:hypothetical protein
MLKDKANRDLHGLKIGTLDASEGGEAEAVLSHGMRGNPGHVAWALAGTAMSVLLFRWDPARQPGRSSARKELA